MHPCGGGIRDRLRHVHRPRPRSRLRCGQLRPNPAERGFRDRDIRQRADLRHDHFDHRGGRLRRLRRAGRRHDRRKRLRLGKDPAGAGRREHPQRDLGRAARGRGGQGLCHAGGRHGKRAVQRRNVHRHRQQQHRRRAVLPAGSDAERRRLPLRRLPCRPWNRLQGRSGGHRRQLRHHRRFPWAGRQRQHPHHRQRFALDRGGQGRPARGERRRREPGLRLHLRRRAGHRSGGRRNQRRGIFADFGRRVQHRRRRR